MKILNLHFNSGPYPSTTVRPKPIEKEILDSLSIELSPKVQDRGVITYKTVSTSNMLVHKALKSGLSWEQKSLDLVKYVFNHVKALINPEIVPKFEQNIISLVPENSDYSGYILCFKSEHFNIRKILVNLDYQDGIIVDSVVITNQTAWVTKFGMWDNESSGNIIVIRCQEHIPLIFDCYSVEIATYGVPCESYCIFTNFCILPNPKLDNNEYEVKVENKNVISCDTGFLNYMVMQYDNDIKSVYQVLSEEDTYEQHLESYRVHQKTQQYSKELTYTSDKVI